MQTIIYLIATGLVMILIAAGFRALSGGQGLLPLVLLIWVSAFVLCIAVAVNRGV